jgi:hypothetical protein
MLKPWKKLEYYVANKFKELGDQTARPTKQSGARTEKGDVITNFPWRIECKQRNTKDITVSLATWNKNRASIPFNSHILPLLVLENKTGQKFAVLDLDDFFEILKQGEE